jgi:hypothetical protein|tara:strand:- start:499 stop:681 length:183 start_codon:yes stop_codon:yes gene_type:complete
MSNVSIAALKDISKYISETYKENGLVGKGDSWVCCAEHLNTIETRKLNRRLGLHKINKQK